MTTKRIGEPYRTETARGDWDAIVIGSGIGGLGAAALLAQQARKRVLVLERHYTAGGFTHVFHRPGYDWDVGVHYIGDAQPGGMLRTIFDHITDGQLDWADMGEIYDRVLMGGDVYDFPKGRHALEARLIAYFPREAEAIRRYFALIGEAVAASLPFFQSKAYPTLLAAVARPFASRRFHRFADRTTREVLESLTSDQRLIGVLTAQFGDYGLPPAESSFAIHALVVHHYFHGASYPVGGAARIAETILPVIEAAGGRVLINAEVGAIAIERGRAVGVRMAESDEVLRAPLVISDIGLANTYGRLLPSEVAARAGLDAEPEAARPSTGHVCLYVGLRQSAEALRLPRTNLWVYPDEHHERTVAMASADPEALQSAFISFPSAKDPDFCRRHPGRATIEVAAFVPYDYFARWADTRWHKRGAEYDAAKRRVAERLLDILYAHVPQTRGQVDVAELSTPLTTRHFANHRRGEIYGLDHSPRRFRQRALRPQTPVAGLWLTGADVVSAGVAGALLGGVVCVSAILRRNVLAAVRRAEAARVASSAA